jgi:hypothetical protein
VTEEIEWEAPAEYNPEPDGEELALLKQLGSIPCPPPLVSSRHPIPYRLPRRSASPLGLAARPRRSASPLGLAVGPRHVPSDRLCPSHAFVLRLPSCNDPLVA